MNPSPVAQPPKFRFASPTKQNAGGQPTHRAPLAAVAAAFSCGIGLAWWIQPPVWAIGGGVGIVAGIYYWIRHRSVMANGALLFLIGALGFFRAFVDAQMPTDSIARHLAEPPRPITCKGVMASDVEWTKPPSGPARRQGWLRLTEVWQRDGWIPASGKVLVRLPTYGVALAYGDRVRLHGEIRGPLTPTLSSEGRGKRVRGDERRWLWLNEACGILTVSDPSSMTSLGQMGGPWVRYRRWVAAFRRQLQQLGRSLLGPLEAAYLEELLLGTPGEIPSSLREAFRRTGTIHVLVVSGFQVGLIGFIAGIGLTILRIPRAVRFGMVIGILAVYGLLTGADPPILRATITGIGLSLSLWRGREHPQINFLGLAALGILSVGPRALADPGFQLSFSAVLGLLVLAPWLARLLTDGVRHCTIFIKVASVSDTERDTEGRFWRWIAQAVATSVAAWVAVVPWVAWHFHLVTSIAPLANLLIVPWTSLLVATGIGLLGAGAIHPGLAAPFVASFTGLAHGLTQLVLWMAQWPFASSQW